MEQKHIDFLKQKSREQKVGNALMRLGLFLSTYNDVSCVMAQKHFSQDEEMTKTFCEEIENVIGLLRLNK